MKRKRATKSEMKDRIESNLRLVCEEMIGRQCIQMNVALKKMGSQVRVQFITLDQEKQEK